MSLAMGIMITYGSYMKKDAHLESCVRQIELFDTGIAFLSTMIAVAPIKRKNHPRGSKAPLMKVVK